MLPVPDVDSLMLPISRLQRLEAFIRRSDHIGFVPANLPTFADLCQNANEKLFDAIIATVIVFGLTENAGHENDGQTKSRGWKMQDWKMTDKLSGVENAGQENYKQTL